MLIIARALRTLLHTALLLICPSSDVLVYWLGDRVREPQLNLATSIVDRDVRYLVLL